MNIIVPINVEVLRVSPSPAQNGTAQSVKLALYDFSQAGVNALAGSGSLVAANNFEHAEELINNQPGMHVHWSVPKVYTHGVQDNATGELGFPNLPNRWVVLRFFRNLNTQENSSCIKNPANFSPSVQVWILESDAHVAPNTSGFENSTNIPWMNDPQNLSDVSYRTAGQKITLSGVWNEPSGNGGPGVQYLGTLLQAPMAYGETFTAYYQHCGNIFGIYDDLSDLFVSANCLEIDCNFSVSYAVLGWVSPLSNDACIEILGNAVTDYNKMPADTRPDFPTYVQDVFERQMQWTLSDYTGFTAANAAQTQGVLSGISAGTVWNITQPGVPSYPTPLPDVSGVQTAIGNNNVEALSAYLNAVGSDKSETDPGNVTANTEWLLNALQFGQLTNLGKGEIGAGQLDEYLHSKSFGSRPGGFIWTVRNVMAPDSKAAPQPDVEVTLPLPLAKILSLLNAGQNAFDRLSDDIAGRQQKLFFDWCYHINAIENNVINGNGNISDDLSGAYLIDGLMHLFPDLLHAGAATEIAGPGQPAPYIYQPAPFNIQVPASLDSNLPGYAFNAGSNTAAAGTVNALLGLFYGLEGQIPNSAAALSQSFETALLLLDIARAGGSDANACLAQAIVLLQTAQTTAQALQAEFAKTTDPSAGIQAAQTAISADLKALGTLTDPNTGLFSQIKITSTQTVPLPAGDTYTGAMASFGDFGNAGSWGARGNFPGIKSLIDQCSGQSGNAYHLADIQAAGLYLGIAYFWRVSGQTANISTAYYIQMAQQEISNAIQDATTAGNALQAALGMLSAGTVQQVGQAASGLSATVIPGILGQLQAATPDIAGAITALQAQLAAPAAGAPLNLAALQGALGSTDWLQFVGSIEQAWITLLNRLPAAQQVSILGNFLNSQISSQYVLGSTPADNFWQPREPVILLAENTGSGEVIRSINRNGQAALLPCRLESEIVGATTTYPAPVSGLSASLNPGITGLSALLQQLAQEAFLLCPEMETVVSQTALQAAAAQNQTSQYNVQQQVVLNPAPAGLTGKLPYYIAWNWSDGTDPFLPLYIFWEAEYVYSQQLNFKTEQLPSNYLQNQFTLDQYLVDNQLQATAAASFQKNTGQPNFFNAYGVISLSGATTANLCEQIRTYCVQNLNYDPSKGPPSSNDPDVQAEETRFYNAYNEYKTMNVLSQGLSGFNASMLQRAQELQLPLNIPASWTAANGSNLPLADFWPTQMLFNQSQNWPAVWASESINANAFGQGSDTVYFNPLRAGFLKMEELTLVDTFGRFVSIINNTPGNNTGQQPVVAESLQVQVQNPLPDHPVYLPPRVVQPSRLRFRWISAESPDTMQDFTEWNPHPAASPVCGWILPNHLDASLMCYGNDGTPLGSLRNTDAGVHWFTVPGEAYAPGTPNRQLMLNDLQDKNANPLFESFLENFAYTGAATDAANFTLFQQVLDTAQQFIITPQMQEDKSLAVLIGQPLVLVQASLQLETMGLPDTSLDAFTYMPWNTPGPQFQMDQNGFIPYNFGNFNEGALPALNVPVKLGALEYQKNGQVTPYFDDGLVGFFLGNDFSVFYTPVQLADNTTQIVSTWLPGANPAVLQPNGAALTVTMVIDPRASVHATTGILPVQDIRIPGDQYSQTLASLLVTFLSAPVLRTTAPISIPAPAETGYTWSWQQVGAVADEPLQPAQTSTDAVFPGSPQYIVDGWLKLKEG